MTDDGTPYSPYTQSDTTFTLPDDTNLVLDGSRDRVTLGVGDTVLVGIGASNDVMFGASPASIELQNAAYVAVQGGTITIDDGVIDPSFGGSGAIDVRAGSLDAEFFTGSNYTVDSQGSLLADVAPGADVLLTAANLSLRTYDASKALNNSILLPGTVSVRADVFSVPNAINDTARIDFFSGADGQGNFLGNIYDFANGGSRLNMPGDGAFGIYETSQFFDAPNGMGTLLGTDYNIIGSNGPFSVFQSTSAGESNPDILNRRVTFSAPNEGGTYTDAVFNYRNGTSADQKPADGGFGIYRITNYYDQPNATGNIFYTDYDVVGVGSINHYVANGAFGVYAAVVTTDQPLSYGTVTRTVFDYFGGSITLVPNGGGGSETETRTAGADGSGTVLSTDTVAAGTAASLFQGFVGFADPAYADGASSSQASKVTGMHASAKVTLADFAATRSGAAHAVVPGSASGAAMPDVVAGAGLPLMLPSPAGHHAVIARH